MSSGINMKTDWTLKSFTHDGTWQTVDLSGDIASGSTGVIVGIIQPTVTNTTVGVRKTGSTDAILRNLGTEDHMLLYIGVDGSRQVDFNASGVDADFYVAGEVDDKGSFNTNLVDVTPGTAGSWQTVNPTNLTTAPVAAFLLMEKTEGGPTNCNTRKTGSSDARTTNTDLNSSVELRGEIIGLDGSGDFDSYFEHSGPFRAILWYVGDINDGLTMKTNAVDKSQTTTGAFTDLDLTGDTAADADGAIFESPNLSGSDRIHIWRENGSTDDFVTTNGADVQNNCMMTHVVGLDAGQVAEFYIEDTSQDDYLRGYSSPIAAATAKRRRVGIGAGHSTRR